jgi:hypothetical protein
MKRKFLFGLLFILIFLLLACVVMYLWNILLPKVLHVTVISYWQALGLLVLCRILFGRFRFGGPMGRTKDDDGSRRLLKEKLMDMDETDRSAFKEEWKRRCERWEKRGD